MEPSAWNSHDWKVKTLESLTAGGGSRLGFTCRSCGRKFSHTTANHRTWAVDNQGVALEDNISSGWISARCPGRSEESDESDRLRIKYPNAKVGASN